MQTQIQRQWGGIARKAPFDTDENTSRMEINTQPGSGELKRLNSRVAYLDSPLPAPAIKFHNQFAYLKTEIASGKATEYRVFDWGVNAQQQVVFCFKFDTIDEIQEDFYLWANGSDSNTGNRVYYDQSEGNLRVVIIEDDGGNTEHDTQIFTSTTLEPDTWYWLNLYTTDGQKMSAKLYTDGVQLGPATDTDFLDISATGNYFKSKGSYITLGAGVSPISIAYFAWYSVASGMGDWGDISPWVPRPDYFTEEYASRVQFLPRDPHKTIFPAQIESSVIQASWVLYPRPGTVIDRSLSGTDEDNVGGFKGYPGQGHTVDMTGIEVLRNHTVFMFCFDVTDTNYHTMLLRSSDSTFSVYMNGSQLCVRYLPESLETAIYNSGYNVLGTDLTNLIQDKAWVAIEYDPDDEGESESDPLFTVYQWDNTDDQWEKVAWDASSWFGDGVTPPSSSEWKLWRVVDGIAESDFEVRPDTIPLYDFRVILGDKDWKTTYDLTSALGEVPAGLTLWLNHDNSNHHVRDENCDTLSVNTGDDVSEIVSLSDRVTGRYMFDIDDYNLHIQWDACPYIAVRWYPTVEDIKTDTDGNVYGPTDGPWYYNSTGSPLLQNRTLARKRTSTVGIHKYITGGGELQRANVPNKPLRMPSPYILGASSDSFAGEVFQEVEPYQGALTYDTQYKFKCTLYDPATGNESNAQGPWYFDTGDYSVAPSEEGCSYKATIQIESAHDLSPYRLYFYRYHSATGTYRFEGSSSIKRWAITTGYSEGRFVESEFTFSLSEDDLALGEALSEDNNVPPYSLYSAISNGRAWYVPAKNPSRVYYSKLFYFGQVPPANVCWTDEGETGDILAMKPGFGGLLLLKEGSIWIIPNADNQAGFMAQQLIPDVGVVSADAAVFANSILWFASYSGIYAYDGNSLQEMTEKLDGLERNVWDKSPRKVRAYYDKENWKVVFVCDGTAITLDVRSGASALCGLPDTCYSNIASADYSGPLYGSDGMIWKETRGQAGLSLVSTDRSNNGPSGTDERASGACSALNTKTEYWTDGTSGNTGSHKIGYALSGLGDTTTSFAAASSVLGQVFTQWTTTGISETRDYDVTANVISMSIDTDTIYIKHLPSTLLTNYFLGQLPMYYRSQYLYYGIDQNEKIVELMTILFGDWVRGYTYNDVSLGNATEATAEAGLYCPYGTFEFTSETLGEHYTSNNVTTGEIAFSEDRYLIRLPVQRRGFRGYYEIETDCWEDMPPIKSVFINFNMLGHRRGGRR